MPPSPPPPPPSPPLYQVIDDLNRQWRDGQPSDELSKAGVMFAMVDGDEAPHAQWERPSWKRDRMSVSISNARHPDVYWHMFTPGFVVNESAITSSISCAYAEDAGSIYVGNYGCRFPSGGSSPWGMGTHYAYPAGQIKDMLRTQDRLRARGPTRCAQPGHRHCEAKEFGYNEIVVQNRGAHQWNDLLPGVIRAVVIQGNAALHGTKGALAAQMHAAFLQRYGLSASNIPLLQYEAGSLNITRRTTGISV